MLNREKNEKTSTEDASGSAQNTENQTNNFLQRFNTLIHNILDFCRFAASIFAPAYIRAYKGANENTLYLKQKRQNFGLFYLLGIKYYKQVKTAKIRQKNAFLLLWVTGGGHPQRPATTDRLSPRRIFCFYKLFSTPLDFYFS